MAWYTVTGRNSTINITEEFNCLLNSRNEYFTVSLIIWTYKHFPQKLLLKSSDKAFVCSDTDEDRTVGYIGLTALLLISTVYWVSKHQETNPKLISATLEYLFELQICLKHDFTCEGPRWRPKLSRRVSGTCSYVLPFPVVLSHHCSLTIFEYVSFLHIGHIHPKNNQFFWFP